MKITNKKEIDLTVTDIKDIIKAHFPTSGKIEIQWAIRIEECEITGGTDSFFDGATVTIKE